jgi:hypothetical protein
LIHAKNALSRKIERENQPQKALLQRELAHMKAEIKESLGALRLHRRSRLRSKLLLADPTRKKFWRFLKGQIKAAGQISALTNKEKKMVFEQHEVEDAALDHFGTIFQGQRVPIYLQDDKIDQIELSLLELDQILGDSPTKFEPAQFEQEVCSNYSLHELCQILANLPSGKASGYDSIPNELLKNSSPKFKHYLLIFLNQILEDGAVPGNLNVGKVMLIHKVEKSCPITHFCFNYVLLLRVVIHCNPQTIGPSRFLQIFSDWSL